MYFDYVTYPAHEPGSPQPRESSASVPVVIAGGGPSGLVAALGLARRGIPSVVIEADVTVCVGSRAACLSRRTLEIVEGLGVGDEFLAKGVAWTGGVSYYRDTEVLRFAMPDEPHEKHPPMINLQQCYAEDYLLQDALRCGLVDLRFGSRVVDVAEDDDTVTATVETVAGTRYDLTASWLVATDGARSAVREALGQRMSGTSYDGSYVIVDVRLRTERPALRYAWFDPPSNPGSTVLMHRQPDDIWRLDYQLLPGEVPEDAVKPENVMPRVRSHLRWIGEDDDVEPEWTSVYRARALTLDAYRHGRILFAGDAAHLVPIFGVRGMNSAVEDAHDLSWRLAAVVNGWSPDSILDGYSDERVHAARENLRHASKSTEFMAPPTPAYDTMRIAVLSLAAEGHEWISSLVNPRQTQPISYAACGWVWPDRAPESGAATAPGEVFPDLPLTTVEGRRIFLSDLDGGDLVLVGVGAGAARLSEAVLALRASIAGYAVSGVSVVAEDSGIQAVSPKAGVTSVADRDGVAGRLVGNEPAIHLLRPDRRVHARWAEAPDAGELGRAARALVNGEKP